MRVARVLAVVLAFSLNPLWARPGDDCRFVAQMDGRLVVMSPQGTATATISSSPNGRWSAASLSPNGSRVLYSQFPEKYGDPVDVQLADLDGTHAEALRVTANDGRPSDIEGISDLGWLSGDRFWSFGAVGHRGVYVDVWQIGSRFALSRLESRLGVFGSPCAFAPRLKLVACAFEDVAYSSILLFDYRDAVSGNPPPEADLPEDYASYVLTDKLYGPKAAKVVRAKALTWDEEGRTLLFVAVGGDHLEVGTLTGGPEGTEGWALRLLPVVGLEDQRVRTIRRTDAGLELVTPSGIFGLEQEVAGAKALSARKTGPPENPEGVSELQVLDRWCPGPARGD